MRERHGAGGGARRCTRCVRDGSSSRASLQRQRAERARRYSVNGGGVRYAAFLGKIRVVTFVPADLQLAAARPALRRAFLNVALAQERAAVLSRAGAISQALQQKNALLRGAVGADPKSCWRSTSGRSWRREREIMLARDHFDTALAEQARRAHARFAAVANAGASATIRTCRSKRRRRDAVAAAFDARLQATRESEHARRTSLAGPHRDDVMLSLDGVSLAAFGSQGQQRTAVLALKSCRICRDARTRRTKRRCCCSTTCSPNSMKIALRAFLCRGRRLRAGLRDGYAPAGRFAVRRGRAHTRRARRSYVRMLKLADGDRAMAALRSEPVARPAARCLQRGGPKSSATEIASQLASRARRRRCVGRHHALECVEPAAQLLGGAHSRRGSARGCPPRASNACAFGYGKPTETAQPAASAPRAAARAHARREHGEFRVRAQEALGRFAKPRRCWAAGKALGRVEGVPRVRRVARTRRRTSYCAACSVAARARASARNGAAALRGPVARL